MARPRTLRLVALIAVLYTVLANSQTSPNGAQSYSTKEEARKAGAANVAEGNRLTEMRTPESYRAAIENFKRAAEAYHAAGNPQLEAVALNSIGYNKNELGETQEALEFFKQVPPLLEISGDRSGEATALSNIAGMYNALGKEQQALDYCKQALPLYQAVEDRRGEAETLEHLASISRSLGDKSEAMKYFKRLLSLSQLLSGKEGKETEARALNGIGAVSEDLEQKQEALKYFNQELLIRRELDDREGEATALNSIGTIYAGLQRNEDALKNFSQALRLFHDQQVPTGEAATLYNIAFVYERAGEKQEALNQYARALTLYRSSSDHQGEMRSLEHLISLYEELNNRQEALKWELERLAVLHARGDRVRELDSLMHTATLCVDLERYQEATQHYNDALPLARAARDGKSEGLALNGLGTIYSNLGDHHQALNYYAQALVVFHAAGDRKGEGITLHNLGSTYEDLGNGNEALKAYQQALPIQEQIKDQKGQAATLNSLGNLYKVLGQDQEALRYYQQALLLGRTIGNRTREAETLSNIGSVYSDLGKELEALRYYDQALTLFRSIPDRNGEAATLNNMASAKDDLGEKDDALKLYEEALALAEKIGNRQGESAMLNNIGHIYQELGADAKALQYYNRALPLVRFTGRRMDEAATLDNLMSLFQASDLRLAILFGKQSVNLLQEFRYNISGLSKETQQTFAKSVQNTYRRLAAHLIEAGRLYEAQQVMDLLKDQEYFEFIRRGEPVAHTGPVALTPIDAEPLLALEKEDSELAAKETLNAAEQQRKDYLDAQLKAAKLAAGQFFDEEGRVHSPHDRQSASRTAHDEHIEATGLQKDLGPNTVALYTLVANNDFHTLLITPRAMKRWDYKITAAALRKKVFSFREALRDPKGNPLPLARELYGIVIGDLDKELIAAKATRILWSLDDVLRYIPMAALHDGNGYLAERFRNVVYSKASSRAGGQFHEWRALGAGVSESHYGLSALDSVPGELRAIIRNEAEPNSTGVMPGKILLDPAFTASSFRAALHQDYPVVHVASHFEFHPGSDTDSFLLLGNGKLSLAELRENSDYSFHDVELLTLSACNTAAGSQGDGREIDGLGFLAEEKGAHAVMASLWDVDDESTGEFMQRFYRELSQKPGITKADALQRAELALLHGEIRGQNGIRSSFAHPFYWAPFILLGNGN